MEQRKRGSAEKDERRNHEHEENVLDHVNGEGGFVESRERRANGEPEEEHAGEESGEAARGKKTGRGTAQREPAAEINQGSEKDGGVEQQRRRPFVEERLRCGRHG